ncbi:hypothetical protein [Fictibacillus sp. 18YEL24]|uniref:hypothetical protein n=1 Tax=Fictibacillus sp. 18YEL24 TaxID=2745875 RepID=UPI0018CCA9A7|nr:hypothetical protein [Fictibacillus sp. 18YEL24]MBH0171665.1 hypothetical protein [Fictibacillus sp. 18YEL24]
MKVDFDPLHFWFNFGALMFGVFLAVGSFSYYKNLNQTKKGIYWAVGCIATCLLVINGIMAIVDLKDEHLKKEAFELLEETYEDRGDPKNESYKNLELVVTPEKVKRYTSYNIYVANFNKQSTYKGKVEITIRNKKDKKLFTHVTETITIKPGEKKEIKNTNYDTWNPGYSWKWLGELKK